MKQAESVVCVLEGRLHGVPGCTVHHLVHQRRAPHVGMCVHAHVLCSAQAYTAQEMQTCLAAALCAVGRSLLPRDPFGHTRPEVSRAVWGGVLGVFVGRGDGVDWATNLTRLVASAVALHGAGAVVISWVLLCFRTWCHASRSPVKLVHTL